MRMVTAQLTAHQFYGPHGKVFDMSKARYLSNNYYIYIIKKEKWEEVSNSHHYNLNVLLYNIVYI